MKLDLREIVRNNDLTFEMSQGNFGLEKEGLRTKKATDGLALTDHPHTLGDRSYHPYVQTDFSEGQPELVTPVLKSIDEVHNWLLALEDVLKQSMAPDEYIWPFSMPNDLPEEADIPIIRVENESDIKYREFLAAQYGKKLQMISGIHYNFSFTDDFVEKLFEVQTAYPDKKSLKTALHLKLARNFLRYEWYLLYLFGAAPYALDNFYESAKGPLPIPEDYSRSIRNGDYGYHNDDNLKVRYDDVETYVNDLKRAVQEGVLSEEREFYGNARLRAQNLDQLLDKGIQYVEFRSFDINPYSEAGMSKKQLAFIHLFLMTMIWLEEVAGEEAITKGQAMMLATAKEHPLAVSAYQAEGEMLLEAMKEVATVLQLTGPYEEAIRDVEVATKDPSQTLAAIVLKDIEAKGYLNLGHELGLKYQRHVTEQPYRLRGFSDLELSTQLLIFDSMQLGVEVEVLDAGDQFIRLTHGDHVEYVRNGNMTSHDTTISHFIMENKTVTKKVLKDAGFVVPEGLEFHSKEQAMRAFSHFAGQKIVVKPKSTNYGWGISVFKQAPSKQAYEEALAIAFEYGEAVLVEEYVAGTEYRFFVLDGKTEAVLLRVPANVTGDGHSTISELIDQKNEDPLRGVNHQTPMGNLEKGKVEQLMLHEQGLTFNSVPEKGERIFLRENSNISTGGDSIDMTDQIDLSYKKVAEGIAEAIAVNVTGIDLIIPNAHVKSTTEAPGYSCLEANFNPAMNMHAYVTQGKGRRLTRKILAMLYPELMTTNKWLSYEDVYGKNEAK